MCCQFTTAERNGDEMMHANCSGLAENKTDGLGAYYREIVGNGLWTNAYRLRAYNEFTFAGVSFSGKSVLDIGGGTGRASFYAAASGARRVVCLEPLADGSQPGQADKFGQIADALNLHNVALIRQRFEDFDEGFGSFDVILLLAAINHLNEWACIHLHELNEARERYKVLFAKLAALAAKGADLIVTDCAPGNIFPLLGLKNPLAPTIEWHKHQPPEIWERLLHDAGFEIMETTWAVPNGLGKPGRRLLGNRFAAYFLRSTFRLHMRKQ